MKQADIRAFVESYLPLCGGRLRAADGDLLRVTLPEAEGAEAAERLLAFGPRAHRRHPEAELVAIGSAFLDRLIGQAAAGGRFTQVFRQPPARIRKPSFPKKLPAVPGREWGSPRGAARPLFLFVYLAEYHIIDVPDDLVVLAVDPARREMLASPQGLLGALRSGAARPLKGWPPLQSLPTPGDLVFSLDLLERRLQRRAGKVKEASAIEIARETANIEAYYRQLITELRAPAGRGGLSAEEEGEKVRVLQLDWKRRVQEVSRFWEARGDVRLSAVAAVMEPCWVLPLQRRGKPVTRSIPGPYAVASCRNGAAEELHCALCGAILRERAEVLGRDLICAEHVAGNRRPGEGGPTGAGGGSE